MTDAELSIATNAAFKAFDALKKGEGIDISKTRIWAYSKEYMIDICKTYIDGQRLGGNDTHEINEGYTIIKRF